MSKKKTNEEFVSQLKDINPNIKALDIYLGATTKINFQCSICNNIWNTRPSSVLSGSGCPKCGRQNVGDKLRKSHEQFVEELGRVNSDVVVLDEYLGDRVKIHINCSLCGFSWMASPHDLLAGHGCPECGKVRQRDAQRKSNEQFIYDLLKIDANIKPLDVYYSNHRKIQFECKKCGKVWSAMPYSVLAGHGCPNCAHASTSFFEQVIFQAFRTCLGTDKVISRNRDIIGMELDVYIPELKVAYEPGSWAWHHDKKKSDDEKRKRCKEKGIRLVHIFTDFKDEMLPYDSDCVVSKYTLGNSEWDETKTIVETLLFEYGFYLTDFQWEHIRQLAQEKSTKKTQEQFVDELRLINKNITVLGKYVDSASKVKVSCDKCNQIWSASANSLLMGHGCPKCKREVSSRKLRLSNSTFLERMQSSQPNIVVLEPYVTSKNKLLCRCSDCGNEWRVSPNRLLRGQGCPECGRKKAAEKRTRSHAEFVESVGCRNPNVRILGTYKGVSTKIKVECLNVVLNGMLIL